MPTGGGRGSFEERPGDGHTSGVLQVDSIVADGRLDVCDGAHCAFVMKKAKGQIAAVGERLRAAGAESYPSKDEGWGTPATKALGAGCRAPHPLRALCEKGG